MTNFTHRIVDSGKKTFCSATTTGVPGNVFEFYDDGTHDEFTVLYLDFAKTFDTIPHELQLKKIQLFGIGKKRLNRIAPHFSSRFQFVKID